MAQGDLETNDLKGWAIGQPVGGPPVAPQAGAPEEGAPEEGAEDEDAAEETSEQGMGEILADVASFLKERADKLDGLDLKDEKKALKKKAKNMVAALEDLAEEALELAEAYDDEHEDDEEEDDADSEDGDAE